MRGVVKKWGNSAFVRVPAQVMPAAGLRLDQAVDIREEQGRIIVELIQPEESRIDDMLSPAIITGRPARR